MGSVPTNTTTMAVPRLLRVLSARLRRKCPLRFFEPSVLSDARHSFLCRRTTSNEALKALTSDDVSILECIAHLAIMTQFVTKHLSEELSVEEFIYQIDHLPVDVKSVESSVNRNTTSKDQSLSFGVGDLISVPPSCLRVTYLGRHQHIFHISCQSDFEMQLKTSLKDWFENDIPEHFWLLTQQ